MSVNNMSVNNNDIRNILNNAQIVSLGKLPAHVPNDPLPKEKYSLLLNGEWNFLFCPLLQEIPEDFFAPDYNSPGWGKIPVPSNWQMENICPPKYINTRYEFQPDAYKLTPPLIPEEENAAGLYRHTFSLPDSFEGRQVLLSFGGFESGLFLWINGQFAGYANNGRSGADFNITPYLHAGENLLAVCVTRFTSGSYLECQDMWRMSGIIRDVRLISVPDCQLFDFFGRSDWEGENDQDAVLRLECKILNHTKQCQPAKKVRAEIFDADDRFLAAAEGTTGNKSLRWEEKRFTEEPEPMIGLTMSTAHISVPVAAVHRWSDEIPYRYRVELSLQTLEGEEVERCCFYHGFREISVSGEGCFLNGQSIKLRGVNRHEFSAGGGHVVTEEEMRRDIFMMKQNNINAVRCSHYPDAELWYDLCDEYGLLVMDEANAESHGISYRKNLLPGNDPRWMNAMLDRVSAMVQGEKNHPSVIMWSLGNELGFGENIALAAAYCKTMDPSRPVHKRQMNSVADMDSETYPSPQNMAECAKMHPDRAFVTNEYAHAMGNAMGNLGEYWDVIHSYPQLIGGFIWEWADHGLLPKGAPDGEFRYGGDFGEPFHDENFCMDGVISADRMPTSKLAEVKKVHEYVKFYTEPENPEKIVIKNGFGFTSLSSFLLHWELLRNGICVQSGEMMLPDTLPGQSAQITIPFVQPEDGRCIIDYSVRLAEETAWAPAGHETAFYQVMLPVSMKKAVNSTCSLRREEKRILVEAAGNTFCISEETGLLTEMNCCGKKIEASCLLEPNFWRAPTDNDRRSGAFLQTPGWKLCGLDRLRYRLLSCRTEVSSKEGEAVLVDMRCSADDLCGFDVSFRYTGKEDGSLLCEVNIAPFGELPVLPRAGVMLHLPVQFEKMTWYGTKEETYPDRKRCGRIGLYEGAVREQRSYLRPQEYGSHQHCLFTALSDGSLSVALKAHGSAAMGASPWLPAELEKAAHAWELPETEYSHLYLDTVQNGLGNRSCGPDVLEMYEAAPVCYGFAFSLSMFDGQLPESLFAETGEEERAAIWAEKQNAGRAQKVEAYSEAYKDPSDPDARQKAGFKA